MHTLRKYLCWVFAFSSVVCLRPALSGILGIVHRPYGFLPLRYLLINVSFAAVATIFGMAWWTVWKGKRCARGWGIAASLIYVLLFVWSSIYFPQSIGPFWTRLAIGVAGLLAFSRRYEQPDSTARSHENVRILGDGTSVVLNKMAGSLMFAVSLAVIFLVDRWLKAKGVAEIKNTSDFDVLASRNQISQGTHDGFGARHHPHQSCCLKIFERSSTLSVLRTPRFLVNLDKATARLSGNPPSFL